MLKLNTTTKIRLNIILVALIFGLLSWIMDAIIDYFFFFHSTFQDVLLFHFSPHIRFERIMIIITYFVFGLYIAHLVLKKRTVESNLEKSEERFKVVAELAKDWEYWITKDRQLSYISSSTERITGYDPKAFLKDENLLEKIIYPEDKEKFLAHTTGLVCKTGLDSFEFRIVTKDNEIKWIEHSCQSVYDSKGKYLGHRVSNRDITRRKLAEEEVSNARDKLEILVKERTSELEIANNDLHLENKRRKKIEEELLRKNEFLNTTINSLTHPFYVINVDDYSVVLANSATNDFISKTNPKCFALTHKRDIPCTEESQCPLEIVKKTKLQTTVEHIHYDKNGNERIYEVHGHPIFNGNGDVIQMIEYSMDITKRKELERKLHLRTREIKSIIDQSPNAIAIFNSKGRLLEINNEWEKFFSSNGHPLSELHILENELLIANGYMPQVKELVKNGGRLKTEPIFSEETNRMIVFDIYDIKDEKGMVNRIVCQIEDRTDEINQEDINNELDLQRRISSAVLDILEEDRRRVSKELHDHIGQKLLLAKLGLEMIEDESESTQKIIDESKKTIIGISKDIKSIIFSLRPAELDNYGLIDALQLMVRNFIELSGIQTSINFYGEEKIKDKKLELNIYRIVQEALNNITKHAKASKVDIELHFNAGMFRGTVKDNGVGFDTDNTGIGTIVGVGYGLISIRERTKISGGEFSIQSQIGKGTEILIEIPVQKEVNA